MLGIDLDEACIATARAVAKDNRVGSSIDFEHGDAFDALRSLKAGAHDLIVLDPPKWILGRDDVDRGLRQYRDLNRLAFEKIRKGGLLVTCSCSGALTESRFMSLLAETAAEARRDARTVRISGAGSDHPVALECPETRYLKVVTMLVGA